MGTANGVAAIALGAYLLVVVAQGNARALFALIKQETGFIKWGVAVAILWWLSTRPEMGELGAGLLAIVILGLAIKIANDPTILSGVTAAWNALPNATVK